MPELARRSLLKTAAGTALLAGLPSVGRSELGFDVGRIKVLAFDFQGSCVDYTGPLLAMGAEINRQKGLDLDWATISSDWRDAYRDVMALVLDHKRGYVETDQVYREALDAVLEKRHLSEHFTSEERDEMSVIWGRMVPWPDTIEGLTRLRRRFTLTTLSNGSMATVIKMVKVNNIPFDEVLTSELVHSYKPAPEVYALVPEMMGARRDEILFCATHFYDLEAAKKFGFWTAWWPRPLEYGTNYKIETEPKPFIDVYAKDLVDLAEKLGAA